MNEPIEVEAENQQQLAVRTAEQTGIIPLKGKTAQELRVLEVSEALLPAYQRASTLELTEDEIKALMAPFADEFIEIRPHDGLIYIPHIHISDRLNQVLKPGKWALVCRRHWLEGGTMYGEYILLIRGCYVGESVGGHAYQPNNPKTNFSDSLESTAGEALRRIAGKRLSCGSQVWNPEYARQWVAKYAAQVRGRWEKRVNPDSSDRYPALKKGSDMVGPGGSTAKVDVEKGPGPTNEVGKPVDDPNWFWGVICPIPRKGMTRADYLKKPETVLDLYNLAKQGDDSAKKRLFGFANNWKPEPREWKGKTYPVSDAELTFRKALDAFLEWEKEKHEAEARVNAALAEPELDASDVPF